MKNKPVSKSVIYLIGFYAVETYTIENASQNTLLLHLHA